MKVAHERDIQNIHSIKIFIFLKEAVSPTPKEGGGTSKWPMKEISSLSNGSLQTIKTSKPLSFSQQLSFLNCKPWIVLT